MTTFTLAPEEDLAAFLRAARTHTPQQDAEIELRRSKYDLTPEEWMEVHSHAPYASAA